MKRDLANGPEKPYVSSMEPGEPTSVTANTASRTTGGCHMQRPRRLLTDEALLIIILASEGCPATVARIQQVLRPVG